MEKLRYKQPITVNTEFKFQTGKEIHNFPFDSRVKRRVSQIDQDFFTYSLSGNEDPMLPGTPIFDKDWNIQGVHIDKNAYVNKATKIDSILRLLDEKTDTDIK